jgi:hypothetical protein
MIANATYCGILNENLIVAAIIFFFNFIILGKKKQRNEITWRAINCLQDIQGEWLFVFVRFH